VTTARTALILMLLTLPRWTLGAEVAKKPAKPGLAVSTTVALDRKRHGSVSLEIETTLKQRDTLIAALRAAGDDSPMLPMLLGDTVALRDLLETRGFTEVVIRQELTPEVQKTTVAARVADVRSVALFGGELTFAEAPGSTLALTGTLGRRHAGQPARRAPCDDVRVRLTFQFPGTVTETDASAERAHAGNAVTYTRTAAQLLAEPVEVAVRVIPDVEGHPGYWFALIAVVTGLVALGVFIVLQKGRTARL